MEDKKGQKVVVFLEPWQRARSSRFLVSAERLVRYFELKLLVLPQLRRIMQGQDVRIYPFDFEVAAFLSRHGVKDISTHNTSHIHGNDGIMEKSVHVAQNWYRQGGLQDILEYRGVNLGLAIQQDIMNLTYNLLKNIRLYESIIDKELPAGVCVENMYSPEGQAIKSLCDARRIACSSLYPRVYGQSRASILSRIAYRRYRSQAIDPVNLHLFNGEDNKDSAGESKILVDAPHMNYLGVILPAVTRFLLPRGCTAYALAKKEDLEKYDVSFTHVKDLRVKKIDHSGIKKEVNNYFSQLPEVFFDIFVHGKINLWSSLKDDLRLTLTEKLPVLASELDRFNEVISKMRPDVILVGDDRGPAFVRAHVLFALSRGIPVVEIEHGIYYPVGVPLDTPICNRVCIWGSAMKKALIAAGAFEDRLEVTGSPKHDLLMEKVWNRSRNGHLKQKRVLLFATQPPFESINLEVIKKIGLFISTRDDVVLVVKPHPSEGGEPYESLAHHFQGKVIVKKGTEDIDDALLESDSLIVAVSTVGVNAAILGKPIVCINPTGDESVYVSEGIAIEVESLEELIPAIEGVLYDKEIRKRLAKAREKFVYDYAYVLDGMASKRVTDLITRTIEEFRADEDKQLLEV